MWQQPAPSAHRCAAWTQQAAKQTIEPQHFVALRCRIVSRAMPATAIDLRDEDICQLGFIRVMRVNSKSRHRTAGSLANTLAMI